MKLALSLTCLCLCLSYAVCQQQVAKSELSACLTHRQRELKSKFPGALVPECDTNGDYKALQCHGESKNGRKFCQCWTPDGSPATSPSRKTSTCECHMARHQATANTARAARGRPLVGAFAPQCNQDGSFKSKQCHSSTGMCWCVDKKGVKKGNSVRDPNLSCS